MEVAARDDPTAAELALLPRGDTLEDVVREPKRAEEAKPITALDATGTRFARVCQLCVKTRRTRWSAAAAARERIASRSAG